MLSEVLSAPEFFTAGDMAKHWSKRAGESFLAERDALD